MKILNSKLLILSLIAGVVILISSCEKDLLNQEPTVDLGATAFWKTEDDATAALYGAYAEVRGLFDRDYNFDGQGEFVKIQGQSTNTASKYIYGSFAPSGSGGGFNTLWEAYYGGVNRTNYVIGNVEKMLATAKPSSVANLEAILGEAKLLRGMVYFRLISLWGDVPYFGKEITDNSQVASLPRLPLKQIKDSIMADFTYAYEKLPVKASLVGRAAKPAALSFRGKLQLFWACWNKNGWPELDTFTPSQTEATAAFTAAAADFKLVINNYGLTLYKNGDPGQSDVLGKATVLPNYYYLFTPLANGDPEMIMAFTHGGGTGSGQGDDLMRDFGTRSTESSQLWVFPRYEIADRYQLTTTGDFAAPLIPMATSGAGRTTLNSAVNPQSYANRDYRMKASILWDYEMMMSLSGLKETGFKPWVFKSYDANVTIDNVAYKTISTDVTSVAGYIFRKFVRNTAGLARNEGNYNFPVMRLADVFLMYAEATNEVNGPQTDAIDLVNKVRRRGNLPALAATKTANKASFFSAIEQERIVELLGEGQRSFDIRRWRILDRIWGAPGGEGKWTVSTQGAQISRYYQNASELVYQQYYIFRIPPSERDTNPNLTQNLPWR